jgi:hypothetical protein
MSLHFGLTPSDRDDNGNVATDAGWRRSYVSTKAPLIYSAEKFAVLLRREGA